MACVDTSPQRQPLNDLFKRQDKLVAYNNGSSSIVVIAFSI